MKIDRGDLKIFIKNCYFARLSFTDISAGEQLETKTPAFYYLAIAFFAVFSRKIPWLKFDFINVARVLMKIKR